MKWTFLIFILSLTSSCWTVIHKNFSLPLNGYVKNNSLKMNGYYMNYDSLKDSRRIFIFYNNGVVYHAHIGGFKSEELENVLLRQNVLADVKSPGAFRIKENNIEINLIEHTNYEMHRVREYRGAVLTDSTFVIFSSYMTGGYPEEKDTIFYHFVPTAKPDSTSWLMRRKWYRGK